MLFRSFTPPHRPLSGDIGHLVGHYPQGIIPYLFLSSDVIFKMSDIEESAEFYYPYDRLLKTSTATKKLSKRELSKRVVMLCCPLSIKSNWLLGNT